MCNAYDLDSDFSNNLIIEFLARRFTEPWPVFGPWVCKMWPCPAGQKSEAVATITLSRTQGTSVPVPAHSNQRLEARIHVRLHPSRAEHCHDLTITTEVADSGAAQKYRLYLKRVQGVQPGCLGSGGFEGAHFDTHLMQARSIAPYAGYPSEMGIPDQVRGAGALGGVCPGICRVCRRGGSL